MENADERQQPVQLSATLADAAALCETDPALLEAQASQVLSAVPGQQQALFLLVSALRLQGETARARAILEAMANALPALAAVHFELGQLLDSLGETAAAVAALSRAVELEPEHPLAWRVLGYQLARAGDRAGAAKAFARQLAISLKELGLLEGAIGQSDDALAPAESMLRELLKIHRTDPFATHMLARTDMRLGRQDEAEQLFARALDLAPDFHAARRDYVAALDAGLKWHKIGPQLDLLQKHGPLGPDNRALRASSLLMLAEDEPAIAEYESLLAEYPQEPRYWIGYGNALRTVGRHDDAIAAYRKAVAIRPGYAVAYRSLANMKTFRFSDEDVNAMRMQLARRDVADEDRCHLHFALGAALEGRAAYAEAFENFRQGSALHRTNNPYDPEISSAHVRRCRSLFTKEFFRARAGSGCPAPDPIFIVGQPRSGSTLIEQILASHSAIEGTTELQDITHIAANLNGDCGLYPELLARIDAARFRALGDDYLARSRVQRKLGRPLFVDKMPHNFEHVGLIHLILPNAKIIDARRHPLACGCSTFTHEFVRGMEYTYDLADIGRYYRDYVDQMALYDDVLPGRVHRICYESLVRKPEAEIRRLLAWCGVPFEDACLRFHETARGVRTASSEQVRKPLYTEALEQWRHYEPWLGPLKAALGRVLEDYPALPGTG